MKKVDFHNDGVPSPPPPHPILYLPGLPDYGFYSAPSDQRGGPCSFADYGSLGPQAAQMLHSEHATSACNSPLQHLHSPDQFKNPGLYMRIYLIHVFWEFFSLIHDIIPCRWSNLFIYLFYIFFLLLLRKEKKKPSPSKKKNIYIKNNPPSCWQNSIACSSSFFQYLM